MGPKRVWVCPTVQSHLRRDRECGHLGSWLSIFLPPSRALAPSVGRKTWAVLLIGDRHHQPPHLPTSVKCGIRCVGRELMPFSLPFGARFCLSVFVKGAHFEAVPLGHRTYRRCRIKEVKGVCHLHDVFLKGPQKSV